MKGCYIIRNFFLYSSLLAGRVIWEKVSKDILVYCPRTSSQVAITRWIFFSLCPWKWKSPVAEQNQLTDEAYLAEAELEQDRGDAMGHKKFALV